MKKATTKKAAPAKNKILLTGLAIGAAGVLGYFGWEYFSKKKKHQNNIPPEIPKPPVTEIPRPQVIKDTPVILKPVYEQHDTIPKRKPVKPKTYNIPVPEPEEKSNKGFPLRRGSKGDNVRLLQEALIAKYGRAAFPKYGADGFFGAEMAAGLKKLKLPAVISESLFHVLTNGAKLTDNSLAKKLYDAATTNDFNKAVTLLKTIKDKDGYTKVSDDFKTNYRINGVRQTLVNGMLNSFTQETQKQQIRIQFLRMGLQYDGSKWSLSGLDGLPVITTMQTVVWKDAQNGIRVPSNMVLGTEISRRAGFTLFENKQRYFLVESKSVKNF